MDKRLTKTTIVVVVIGIAIIVLVAGADIWFGIDLGVFKAVIPAAVAGLCGGVAASQASKVSNKDGTDKK